MGKEKNTNILPLIEHNGSFFASTVFCRHKVEDFPSPFSNKDLRVDKQLPSVLLNMSKHMVIKYVYVYCIMSARFYQQLFQCSVYASTFHKPACSTFLQVVSHFLFHDLHQILPFAINFASNDLKPEPDTQRVDIFTVGGWSIVQ